MVNASMYDVYYKWLKSDQPSTRPNVVITGSSTVSSLKESAANFFCISYHNYERFGLFNAMMASKRQFMQQFCLIVQGVGGARGEVEAQSVVCATSRQEFVGSMVSI